MGPQNPVAGYISKVGEVWVFEKQDNLLKKQCLGDMSKNVVYGRHWQLWKKLNMHQLFLYLQSQTGYKGFPIVEKSKFCLSKTTSNRKWPVCEITVFSKKNNWRMWYPHFIISILNFLTMNTNTEISIDNWSFYHL